MRLPARAVGWWLVGGAFLLLAPCFALSQDRLSTMPRYDRYEKLRREIAQSVERGVALPTWEDDSTAFTYTFGGKTYRTDTATLETTETEAKPRPATRPRRPRRAPERGRQFDTAEHEGTGLKAVVRDRNVYLVGVDGVESPLTEDGSVSARIKNGVASWVYGEELGVREAMWFSPDGRKLAYYRFDETPVKDYFLVLGQAEVQGRLDVEAYPKAGGGNPKVELRVVDLVTRLTQVVDVGFGPDGTEMSEYIYQVRWSPDGNELFFHRTNRKQNAMEWCAADPDSGAVRVVVREEHRESWTDNAPPLRMLDDQRRFLWISDRSGFRNLYLGDLDGRPLQAVTRHGFDVESVVAVNEASGQVWYTARSGDNPYLMQLHRANLDGTGDVRLTDPSMSHSVGVSPDGKHIVDVAERIDVPPTTRLLDADGKVRKVIAASNLAKFEALGLRKVQRITFPAADGSTTLYGMIELPSDFDPKAKYPAVVGTYAGPESGGGQERFQIPDPLTELGFVFASFEGRGTQGRGKAFKEAVYGKLGIVEIDDQAAGGRYLQSLPFIDGKRIGIHGTSYGGYASAMALLRHPAVFAAAAASSSVTDWRNYDTIYTERYMGLPWPGENLAGYDAGSAMKYARNLKGRLMLFYGTADNNVHPSNTMQLAKALNEAGKSYEMMAGPDAGHASLNFARQWEFFMDNLVLSKPTSEPLKAVLAARAKRKT